MKWAEAMRKAASALLPWAPKHERQAAIDDATVEKQRSQGRAAESRKVQQQLYRLVRENHYAQSIEEQIIRGHERGR